MGRVIFNFKSKMQICKYAIIFEIEVIKFTFILNFKRTTKIFHRIFPIMTAYSQIFKLFA